MPVVGLGPWKSVHCGTHPQTHTDIQWLRCQGRQAQGPVQWYRVSWSSRNPPHFTIPTNVAAPQVQMFAFSGVVGSLPLIYGANIWPNPRPNSQLEVGQPLCLRGSSQSLQSADNGIGEGYTHRPLFVSVQSQSSQGIVWAAKLPAVQARWLPGC